MRPTLVAIAGPLEGRTFAMEGGARFHEAVARRNKELILGAVGTGGGESPAPPASWACTPTASTA